MASAMEFGNGRPDLPGRVVALVAPEASLTPVPALFIDPDEVGGVPPELTAAAFQALRAATLSALGRLRASVEEEIWT
jgi:hypothetical protein